MDQTAKPTRQPITRTNARTTRPTIQRKLEHQTSQPITPAASQAESVTFTSKPSIPSSLPSKQAVEQPAKDQQLDDELKKGILFFRLIWKNKRLKNLSLGFSSIRNSVIVKNNNTRVMVLKLHKLEITKKQEATALAFRKLATNAAKKRRGYLRNKSVILEAHKKKLLERLADMLDDKYKETCRVPVGIMIEKKRIRDRVKVLNRSAKLKFFHVLLRNRYREGLHKIKLFATSRGRSKPAYLRNCMRIISKKTTRTIELGFEYIKRIAMYKKAQALKQQQVEKRAIPERQQKLMEQVDQLAAQNAQIKKKYEAQIGELQARRQQLIQKLEELMEKNSKVTASIEQLQQIKKNQIPTFTLLDVYERVYNNFLYFLKNSGQQIPKADLLKSLSTPMCRIDMPIDIIRQQNQALAEVIKQYERLNLKLPPQPFKQEPLVVKPYEQLLRENSELYSVLGALIENSMAAQNDKEYVQIVSEFSNLEGELVKMRQDLDGK